MPDLNTPIVRYAPMLVRVPIDRGEGSLPVYIAARCHVIDRDLDGYHGNDLDAPVYEVRFPLIVRRPYDDQKFRIEANNHKKTQHTYCLYKTFEEAKAVAKELSAQLLDQYCAPHRNDVESYFSQLGKLEQTMEEYNSNDLELIIWD